MALRLLDRTYLPHIIRGKGAGTALPSYRSMQAEASAINTDSARPASTISSSTSSSLPIYAVATASAYHETRIILSRNGALPSVPNHWVAWSSMVDFSEKLDRIRSIFQTYYWSIYVRLYLVAATLVSVVTVSCAFIADGKGGDADESIKPWPVIVVARRHILTRDDLAIQDAMNRNITLEQTDFRSSDLLLALAASFGILTAIWTISWIPLAIIRYRARKQLKQIISTYSDGPVLWSIATIGTWSGRATFIAKLPWKAVELSVASGLACKTHNTKAPPGYRMVA